MKALAAFAVASLALCSFASMARATPSSCDAVAGNIVSNCGFEGGTHSVNANGSVPDGWDADSEFAQDGIANGVEGTIVHSGANAVQMGAFTILPGGISQTLTDVAGTTYNGSIFIEHIPAAPADPSEGAFFLSVGGAHVTLDDTDADNAFTKYTFSFVGTGSDTLSLSGTDSIGAWYADDIVITAAPVGVPEPITLSLFGAGLIGAVALRRRNKSKV